MCVTDLAVSKPSKLNLEANEYYREREREGVGRKKNQKIRKKKRKKRRVVPRRGRSSWRAERGGGVGHRRYRIELVGTQEVSRRRSALIGA